MKKITGKKSRDTVSLTIRMLSYTIHKLKIELENAGTVLEHSEERYTEIMQPIRVCTKNDTYFLYII